MKRPVRRIVTGHDDKGRSTIWLDGEPPSSIEMASLPGLFVTELWATETSPADNGGARDDGDRPVRLEPPHGGSVFRIVEFPPAESWRAADTQAGFASIGATHALETGGEERMMHKTASVDYIVVLKGEIWAVLEEAETLMRAGDVLVQRGTNHAWHNRSSEPCVLAAILVSATTL